MQLSGRSIVLLGRFSAGARERLRSHIEMSGGSTTRDLTRRSDMMIVGALAASLIERDGLALRLDAARGRGIVVCGERRFARTLEGEEIEEAAPYPVAPLLTQTGLTLLALEILAAFDIIVFTQTGCRFSDAAKIRSAAELLSEGRSLKAVVQILVQVRDRSPKGRHKVILTPSGEAALQWQDGLTTLEGQGFLPLDVDLASVDALFDAAVNAEAEGDLAEAARFYDLCGRADPKDPVAFFNLGNIRLSLSHPEAAVLAYQRALSRDPGFIDARYNLAQALETVGRADAAAAELTRLLDADPTHSDAIFNLAQIRLERGELATARTLYERYLSLDPPEAWAAKARKALLYCGQAP